MSSQVWCQVSWKFICLEKPNTSVFEVVEKLLIRLRVHFSGPDHLGIVNVRPIVNPFIMEYMIRTIADDHQMPPFMLLQLS